MPVDFSDAQLLRDFASSRDQWAFAELVARHQDMVFGTALRRTGRSDLAADIAQHVFLALAHKAAWLSTRPNVGGWLYKATLLESIRRQRDESRRHSRERRYAEEEMKNQPPLEAVGRYLNARGLLRGPVRRHGAGTALTHLGLVDALAGGSGVEAPHAR